MRAELAAKADGFSRRAKKMVERAKAGWSVSIPDGTSLHQKDAVQLLEL